MQLILRNDFEGLGKRGDIIRLLASYSQGHKDHADRAALEADRNFMLRIRDREAKLIKKIREALERIENDTYGICESCGEDISIKRLKALSAIESAKFY